MTVSPLVGYVMQIYGEDGTDRLTGGAGYLAEAEPLPRRGRTVRPHVVAVIVDERPHRRLPGRADDRRPPAPTRAQA